MTVSYYFYAIDFGVVIMNKFYSLYVIVCARVFIWCHTAVTSVHTIEVKVLQL